MRKRLFKFLFCDKVTCFIIDNIISVEIRKEVEMIFIVNELNRFFFRIFFYFSFCLLISYSGFFILFKPLVFQFHKTLLIESENTRIFLYSSINE